VCGKLCVTTARGGEKEVKDKMQVQAEAEADASCAVCLQRHVFARPHHLRIAKSCKGAASPICRKPISAGPRLCVSACCGKGGTGYH
jgi:hypothetical protein